MSFTSSPDNSVLFAVGSFGDQYGLWAVVEAVKFRMEESNTFEVAGNAEDGCDLGQIGDLANSLMQRSASNLTAVIFAHGNIYEGTHKIALSTGDRVPSRGIFDCLSEVNPDCQPAQLCCLSWIVMELLNVKESHVPCVRQRG